MRKFLALVVLSVLALSYGCNPKIVDQKEDTIIGKHNLELTSDRMTPEVLWALGRVGGGVLSPDHSKLLYGVTYYSVPENRSNRELFVMNSDGTAKKQITKTVGGEYEATWKHDGSGIYFLAASNDGMQLWEMDYNGENRKQRTFVKGGINGYHFSPKDEKLLYTANVQIERVKSTLYEGLDKSTGRIMNDLMYRHWDEWVDAYSHVFIAERNQNGDFESGVDIMKGEPYESPMKPFGGMEQITWSNDGEEVLYTCKKSTGKTYAFSTNSDIYAYNLASKKTLNLTKGMMGYDVNPTYSPDGKYLAWESMERDGYEADKNRIFVLNLATGEQQDFSSGFDQSAHGFVWTEDSKGFYFISTMNSTDNIYYANITEGEIERVAEKMCNYQAVMPLSKEKIIVQRVSMAHPADLYVLNPTTNQETNLTKENDHILDQLALGEITKRNVKTTDGKDMLVWVVLPSHFDESKEYPVILQCKGGPQGPMSQWWSYRWNFMIMAANDYVIVSPARRGVSGHGQAWQEQISGDYGGQNMLDYFSAIDEVKKEPWADENRIGAVGASYGGFSVFWLAGHHEQRFKAFIAHDGMFNLEQQYLETEEMFFVNWDLGGPYWDKKNKVAQRSYANSPHLFVDKWDTPILIIHSELDYRIVASQGMSAFNAAVMNNVPAEYLYFPDENHWVLKPQNGILWQRTFFDWLDKWLK